MWVFLKSSFLSIVMDPVENDTLVVRARFPGDITEVFPKAKVTRTPDRDYLYRAFIPRDEVANAMAHQVMNLDATNFKSSVKSPKHHDVYMKVWWVMADAQHQHMTDTRKQQELKRGKNGAAVRTERSQPL